MLLSNSERFALLLAENLKVGSNRTVISDNIGNINVVLNCKLFVIHGFYIEIFAELVNPNNITDIYYRDPGSNLTAENSIFIPASYIELRHNQQPNKTGEVCKYCIHIW